MIKRTKSISINILSAFVILTCLLLGLVGSTNAWFTDSFKNGVKIEVVIANLNLNLYQTLDAEEVEILTIEDNDNNANAQYVEIEGEILPNTPVDLLLTLKNEDAGSASMYVRFKFELYSCGVETDSLIESEIVGNIIEDRDYNFVKPENEENGYYYYQDDSGNNVMLERGDSAVMISGFQVPYTSFIDSNGNMLITNSETIFIKVIIEASVDKNFAQ